MDPIYTFLKSVKRDEVVHHDLTDSEDVANVEQVIQKLEQLSKVSKSTLDELDLRSNHKKWATSLVKGYPENVRKEEGGYLLSDFTDAMRTRMREESKYAIGLLMRNKLILCHSLFGEETITPEWKTIPRMLDSDNVLRYVCFVDEKGIILVRFWEREASSSFIEWLGLPRKQVFLFGGRYRIYSEIEGITAEFQLTEEEMKDWIDIHPELQERRIRLSNPIEFLNVNEVRVGKKRYENTQDFIQDYRAESYGIPYYQEQYEKINKGLLPLLMKYYDEKTQLVRREGEQETVELAKSTTGFDILFVNEKIELRASYLGDIATRIINGEPIKICHAGLNFGTPPFTLGSIKIYNEIRLDSLVQQIAEYHNDTKLQDRNLNALLKYTILVMLAKVNGQSPISHFFGPLAEEVVKTILIDGKWSKLEDEVLEYKSQDFLTGGDRQVTEKLVNDLTKKLKGSACKVYVIGVEDDGTLNPLPASRLKSDRIEGIRSGVQNQLGIPDIYALPVVQKEGGILLLLVLRT